MGSIKPNRITLLPQNNQLLSSMTILRNCQTESRDFNHAFETVATQIIAAALDHIAVEEQIIETPTGKMYSGVQQKQPVCGVSILRAGACFEETLRRLYSGPLSFGKILIQRDESTSLPHHLYTKLPKSISKNVVLVLEPMLATGGSACHAINVIKEANVLEENIIFVNVIASRKGLNILASKFPKMRIVTSAVDIDLDGTNHIIPGLGDFGDRFYGTDS